MSGGASKSIIFPQILADVLGIKINVPSGEEFGARGAAYIASVAVNKFPNLNQAVNTNKKIKQTFYPNKKYQNYYCEKYKKYLKLRKSLENIW